jgi:hypothetical protein
LDDVGDVAGDDHAVVEDGHAVCDRHDQIDVMLDQQDGNAERGNPADHLIEAFDLLLGQTGGRLIQKQQARRGGKRARDFEPALQAERQKTRFFVRVFREIDKRQKADRGRAAALLLGAEAGCAHGRIEGVVGETALIADHHVFHDAQVAEQLGVLKRSS